jgi:hypothetical protein
MICLLLACLITITFGAPGVPRGESSQSHAHAYTHSDLTE